jgi:ABC-type polysaccharide/polyol phosphate transport system ATPase subunit/2-polyprenyl-3-methyl-5-hydroxy-6-metoxy-1,4-benzoquinol methylase
MAAPLLQIDGLTLEFDLFGRDRNFRRRLVDAARGRSAASRERFRALDGITLKLMPGERLAVMGHNGAGKSSLLKVIAGIYPIEQGHVELGGSIAPLIELGAGFNPNLSARQNIVLNGAMFGYTRRQMIEKTPGILEFAGLVDFADVPIRNYSTGMRRRLAFTIATDLRPDLLIIDEIFAGGDLQFIGRARSRMTDLMGKANALIMVSHQLPLLEQFCVRGIWLDHGRIRADGPVAEVTAAYRASVPLAPVMTDDEAEAEAATSPKTGSPVEIKRMHRDPMGFHIGPEHWEPVHACHCQGQLVPTVMMPWKVCHRCRTWVNSHRLSREAMRELFMRDEMPVGVTPPGWSRVRNDTDAADRLTLVQQLRSAIETWDRATDGSVTIAQVGCGDGELLEGLAAPGRTVAGIELNPALAQIAAGRDLDVSTGGCEALPEGRFDVLIAAEWLGAEHDIVSALRRLRNALKPGGRLVLIDAVFGDPVEPLDYPAHRTARYLHNYLLSRGGLETQAHVAGFVEVSDLNVWQDRSVVVLR